MFINFGELSIFLGDKPTSIPSPLISGYAAAPLIAL